MNTVEKTLIAVLSSALYLTAANAQTNDIVLKDATKEYAVDQRDIVVRSGTGLCWRRTGVW